jgi:hypothetical protein
MVIGRFSPELTEEGFSWIDAGGLIVKLALLLLAKLWPAEVLPDTETL